MFDPSSDPFEKAHNRGCMWGMAGGRVDQCPYQTKRWRSGGCKVGTPAPPPGIITGTRRSRSV